MRKELEIRKSEKTMGGSVRSIYYAGRYRRMASIGVKCLCIFFCLTQDGFCLEPEETATKNLASEILDQAETGNIDELKSKFDELEKVVEASEDSLGEARKFLESFIEQVNVRYGLSLTLPEACRLVKENLHNLNLPPEVHDQLLILIQLFESDDQATAFGLYWPWEWNWFGLNKKEKSEKNEEGHINNSVDFPSGVPTSSPNELSGNIYFGVCEAFAGALLCVIPHPVAWSAGITMIADGGRRVVDGVIQLSDERRLDPNYEPPSPPF